MCVCVCVCVHIVSYFFCDLFQKQKLSYILDSLHVNVNIYIYIYIYIYIKKNICFNFVLLELTAHESQKSSISKYWRF